MVTTEIFDAFAEFDAVERTVIKPGGRGRGPDTPEKPIARMATEPRVESDLARLASINPLVAAANPLLVLVSDLREAATQCDVMVLREHLVEAVRNFESHAHSQGVAEDALLAARYALCTFIDETIMSRPWGAHWGGRSLLVTFHNDNLGGEKVFAIMERAAQDAGTHIDLLELLYLCLSLGFQGRYRRQDGGRDTLNHWRERLHHVIRQARGDFERELSPHWNGVVDKRPQPMRSMSLWIVIASAGVLLLAIFLSFSMALDRQAEPVIRTLASIPGVAFDPKPVLVVSESRLHRLLAPEIERQVVRVDESANSSKITLIGDGVFESGSASVSVTRLALIERIGTALREASGRVQVVGHTDDQPIRSPRYASNVELSRARANEVTRLLVRSGNTPERFYAVGRGDAEPLVANTSFANRARNRRVEIIVQH